MNDDKNKFSRIIIDGEIIDLNNVTDKKLEELQEKLEKEQNIIRNQIDEILGIK